MSGQNFTLRLVVVLLIEVEWCQDQVVTTFFILTGPSSPRSQN